MEQAEIWVLESDTESLDAYRKTLGSRYDVQYFSNLHEFRNALAQMPRRPDLIVAETHLSDGHFLDVLRNTDGPAPAPFIAVSKNDDLSLWRECFHLGAQDCLSKPFRFSEFLVKVENILNRTARGPVRLISQEVVVDGVKIENLTAKQIQLLGLFLSSPQRTVNRTEILTKVWGDTTVHPKTVDVHLYNLRRKIGPYGYIIRSEGRGRWSLLSERRDLNPTRTPEVGA